MAAGIQRRTYLGTAVFVAALAVCALALVALALFSSLGAVLLLLSALLWLALLRLARRVRRQDARANARLGELRENYDSIISLLFAALAHEHEGAADHAGRIGQLASVIAWQMGLRKHQLALVQKAAVLHDLGKLEIAQEVLSAPGPLTEEQWAQMKRHPQLGYEALRDILPLREVAEIVLAHHERYDGSGYPRGAKGSDIPLGARLFAVLDAYVAMTSHRPYRKAMAHRTAVEEVLRHSGSQFDPQVAQAFIEAERRGLLHPKTAGERRAPDLLASARTEV